MCHPSCLRLDRLMRNIMEIQRLVNKQSPFLAILLVHDSSGHIIIAKCVKLLKKQKQKQIK